MVTALYGAICGLLIIKLSFTVIGLRRQYKVRYGDGGHKALKIAIRAHANATECIPIVLILLGLLEFNNAPKLLIHCIGITFIIGRIIHSHGLLKNNMPGRVLGTQISIVVVIGLAILNFVYLPFDQLI